MKTILFLTLHTRQIIFAFCFCAVMQVPGRAANAYSPALFLTPLPNGLQLQTVEAASPAILSTLRYGELSPQKGPYKPGIIGGCIMFCGGGLLYTAGHILADRAYENYHKSAFTERTDRLRRDILIYNVMRFGGGALGGIGLIAILVSF